MNRVVVVGCDGRGGDGDGEHVEEQVDDGDDDDKNDNKSGYMAAGKCRWVWPLLVSLSWSLLWLCARRVHVS